jgi:Zn-dependent protease with chaperone function
VLAHEYGHFRNQDTAGGSLALRVERSLGLMLARMAAVGSQRLLNPAWWLLRGFEFVFVRVSQGACRLQEVLADRAAAIAYGSEAFVLGYRHVVDRSAHFAVHLDAAVREAAALRRPLDNVYRYEAQVENTPEFAQAVERIAESAMAREPRATDSHPSPRQRIAWVERLGAPRRPHDRDHDPVWSLFDDAVAIERRLTAILRDDLAIHHNIVFAPSRPGQSP